MTILFRCNAGPEIGFGHLTRCRALAHALSEQGEQCVMAGPDKAYANAEDEPLFSAWEPLEWKGSATDARSLIELAAHHSATGLVLDDYRVNEAYQLVLRSHGLKWLQFEARTDQPIWADIVLNANPVAKAEDYAPILRNPATRLLLGPRYAILRPEFAQVNPRNPSRPLRKVLVTFGGGDDRGAILFVLSTLSPVTPKDLHFLVISGSHNPRNGELKDWIRTNAQDRVHLVINPQPIAPLFAECDLAIMAGGTTTYEAACCGLPMLLITIAENQLRQAQGWAEFNVAVFAGSIIQTSCEKLLNAFSKVTEPYRLQEQSRAGRALVDGLGAQTTASIFVCGVKA